jgi:hypothetical protein
MEDDRKNTAASGLNTIEDMGVLVKKINLVVQENKSLQNLKERYVEHAASVALKAKELRAMADALDDVARCIDPLLGQTVKKQSLGPRVDYDEILRELVAKMSAGLHVSGGMIHACYSDLEPYHVQKILVKLRMVPGVRERKEGVRLFLFMKETVEIKNGVQVCE